MHYRKQDAIIGLHLMLRSWARSLFILPRLVTPFLLAAMLYGCATAKPVQAEQAEQAPKTGGDAVTVENLLRWPLEGPSGVDQAMAHLRQAFVLEELTPGEFYGKARVMLGDGYILGFTSFSPKYGIIHLGLEQTPCFSPKRAAEITSAVIDPVFQDVHGVDQGRSYDARRNGVWVSFTSTPETYQCVDAIHIRPTRNTQP